MNAKDAIRSAFNISSMVLKAYISDLEDADLMRRPGEGCNHLAWQLGHLISSEVMLLGAVGAATDFTLPDGFASTHAKENAGSDDAESFHTKAEYAELFDTVRAASLAALESYPEERLDEEAPENFRSFCPTNGDVFMLAATHPMMHAGQFVIIRRQTGKPVLM